MNRQGFSSPSKSERPLCWPLRALITENGGRAYSALYSRKQDEGLQNLKRLDERDL